MSLYLKYRPQSFEEIKGNREVVQVLEKMLTNLDTCPHSFLLHGPTGCGKTTIARIISSKLGCSSFDQKELDTADFRGIDTIRELRHISEYKSLGGGKRAFILDECHKLTNDAQNALLKLLEDTPPHIYLILCTTDPNKLLNTIRGRCQQFQMKQLNENQMYGLLRGISKSEGETLTQNIYESIIKSSFGLPRNAVQILEQVLNTEPDKRETIAEKVTIEQLESIELSRALIKRSDWKEVRTILGRLTDQEPEEIRRQVLGYCQAILLKEDNVRAGAILEQFIDPFYNSGFPQLVYACYTIIKTT